MSTFADRLNCALNEAALSAAELAERSGITESASGIGSFIIGLVHHYVLVRTAI